MESKLMHNHVRLKDFYISKINPMCQNAKKSYFYTNKVFKSLLICRNIKNKDPRFATANTNILPLNKNPSESAQTLVSAFKHSTQSNFFFSYLLMVSLSLVSTNDRLSAGDSRLRDPNSLLQSSQWKAVVLVAASLLVSALPWWWGSPQTFCHNCCLWFKGGQDQATVL